MKKWAAGFLLGIGLLQMTGDVLRWPTLKALGAATAASPAPKVFSSARGLETFSTRFVLEWSDRDGHNRSLVLTPEIYSRLRGPYNRRNVYGAVLAYGPVFATSPSARPLYESVLAHAFCGEASLHKEFGIDSSTIKGSPRVRLEPRAGTNHENLPLLLEPSCP